MIKALILAPNYMYYLDFIRRFKLDKQEYRYVVDYMHAAGIDRRIPVWIIEGFGRNRNYDFGFMKFMSARFFNMTVIREEELWNEDTFI